MYVILLSTLLRVWNAPSWRKMGPTVAVVVNPTRSYWGWFNDWIFPSWCLLQLSPWAFPRGRTGSASTASLKLVRLQRDHEGTLSIFLSMDNNIGTTKSHHSSNRSILYPLEKESCTGSNVSCPPFGHVQCRWKTTEAQISKNHCCQCAKWWFLL